MDQLQGMKVFVRVAQHMGFAAAARELRMSTAAVSKHVSSLEQRIGIRLFDRTTRRVGLTEAGRVYLDRCLECLQAFDDADASVGELAVEPKGLLRVTAPIDFSACLVPVIELMSAYAGLVVDLRLSNRSVDLVEEGIDVAIRVATSLDGQFVARPIAQTRMLVVGAPEYFRKHGRPKRPQDLASHRTLVFTEPRPLDRLRFTRDGREVIVPLQSVMTANAGAPIVAAAVRGIGLATMPSFLAPDELATGRLEPVLLDWSLPTARVFVVYPHRRFVSPKVRVLVDALRATFGDGTKDPWWAGAGAPSRRTAPDR